MGTDERFGEATVQDGEGSLGRGIAPEMAPDFAPDVGAPDVGLRALPAFLAAGPAAREAAEAAPVLPARLRGAVNPLLAAAGPLLDLASRLRERVSVEDAESLRDRILADLRGFEEEAAAAGLPPEEVRVARFALCITLDDVVRATPWGARCRWAREGLIAAVDREAGGPDRFFDLLDTMLSDPRLHRLELELFYACLSLGFEGKFRDKPRGAHDLAHLRDELYRVLRRLRGERERGLSPHWRGVAERFRPLGFVMPPWLAAVGVAALLGGLYVELNVSLTERAEPVVARLGALLPDRPIEIVRAAPPPPPNAGPALAARITSLLQPEIRSGAVAVLAGDDGALVIRVEGAGMFPTGSDQIKARYRAVVDRVGQALGPEAGRVVVVGHTDDQTPNSGPLATPQALTEARALAVRKILERTVGPARLSSEGHGDREPVAPNTSPVNRGANRRVDVRLYPE
ncbi:type IVB secretion system protein IcmH/DotU [Azospirillum sp. sgz302134]